MGSLAMGSVASSGVESSRVCLLGFTTPTRLYATADYQVWLAKQLADQRSALLRQLRQFPEPAALRRLLAEANRLTGFEHPQVNTLLGAWVEDTQVWCALAHQPGQSLSQLLARGAPPLSVASRILLDVGRGVVAVHAFDPLMTPRPLVAEDVWIENTGAVRFVPLCSGLRERAAARRGDAEAQTLRFLAEFARELLSGAPFAEAPAESQASTCPEAVLQLVDRALRDPEAFASASELLVHLRSALEAHTRIADAGGVSDWQQGTPVSAATVAALALVPPRLESVTPEQAPRQEQSPPAQPHAPEPGVQKARSSQPKVAKPSSAQPSTPKRSPAAVASNKPKTTSSTKAVASKPQRARPKRGNSLREIPASQRSVRAPAAKHGAPPPAPDAPSKPAPSASNAQRQVAAQRPGSSQRTAAAQRPVVARPPAKNSARTQSISKRPVAPGLDGATATVSARDVDASPIESALVRFADSLPQPPRPSYLDELEALEKR